MKTETHTVTIPIDDYNELLKAQEMTGVTKLDKASPIWQAIDIGIRQQNMRTGYDKGMPENIELYFKQL